MSKILKISRSAIYYNKSIIINTTKLEEKVVQIFKDSRGNYGARKIKIELDKTVFKASRRKIRAIMDKKGIVSSYTVKKYKVVKDSCNESKIENIVDRKFNREQPLDVVVSDLTYINVGGKWNYICVILDLFNREILGFSAGKNKSSNLVSSAFSKIRKPLNDINIFHTDRGSEFKNKAIDDLLETFNVTRSLSRKGSPHDNAVAESTFKVIKTEFVYQYKFESLEELQMELFDYVNWYNNCRIHGSLNYLTPVEYRLKVSDKILC